MKNLYAYRCYECHTLSPEEQWNITTHKHCSSGEYEWHKDPHFTSLAQTIEEDRGAWFICPSCDETIDEAHEMERVLGVEEINRKLTFLLQESW